VRHEALKFQALIQQVTTRPAVAKADKIAVRVSSGTTATKQDRRKR
jgi:hypothetical protein